VTSCSVGSAHADHDQILEHASEHIGRRVATPRAGREVCRGDGCGGTDGAAEQTTPAPFLRDDGTDDAPQDGPTGQGECIGSRAHERGLVDQHLARGQRHGRSGEPHTVTDRERRRSSHAADASDRPQGNDVAQQCRLHASHFRFV
jgi:hypothetical protein